MKDDEEGIDWAMAMERLESFGVVTVRVSYDGGGDSGDVNNPEFLDINGDEITDKELQPVEDMIYGLCEDKLLEPVGNWWDNMGGYGTVTIQIPSGEYTIESSIRIDETKDESFDGNLKEFLNDEY